MGVLAVVVAGRPGPRGGQGESDSRSGRRGGVMRGGSDAGRDDGPVLPEPSSPVDAFMGWNTTTQ